MLDIDRHSLKESSVRVILESLIWIYKMRLKKTFSGKVTAASLLMDQGKFVRTTVAVSNGLTSAAARLSAET